MTDVTTPGSKVDIEVDGASAPAVGSTELLNLRSEGEQLKLERDNAQLRAELAQLGKPWWRKGSVVTTLTAILAAVVPLTTAVQAHYQKERELALQESRQAHEIRTSYLDRLDKPGARLRTLRFVLATTSDPALKEWAQEEKKLVQGELDEIDRQIAALISRPTAPVADPSVPVGAVKASSASVGGDPQIKSRSPQPNRSRGSDEHPRGDGSDKEVLRQTELERLRILRANSCSGPGPGRPGYACVPTDSFVLVAPDPGSRNDHPAATAESSSARRMEGAQREREHELNFLREQRRTMDGPPP